MRPQWCYWLGCGWAWRRNRWSPGRQNKIKIQTIVSQSAIITMMPKPMAVAMAILENSFLSGFVHLRDSIVKPEIQYHKIGGTLQISLTVRALPLDQPNGILAELLQWFQMLLDLIHGSFGILWKGKYFQAKLLSFSRMSVSLLQLTGLLLDLRTQRECVCTPKTSPQARTQVQQWRVVTVRRCTATTTTETSRPPEKETENQFCLLPLCDPAGWLLGCSGLVVAPVWEAHLCCYLNLISSSNYLYRLGSSVVPLKAVIQKLPMWTLVDCCKKY